MIDIKQKEKALALLNDLRTERGFAPVEELYGSVLLGEALCRALEKHEAFRQEVSDVVANWKYMSDFSSFETMLKLAEQDLFGFIIPKPKPDPLVEVLHEVDTGPEWDSPEDYCNKIRAALEARGLEIREKNDG